MSIPTLQGLQTALSGLVAEQTAMDTTGNNIANANTEGYSRETALLEPNPPLNIPAVSTLTGRGAQLGAGVTVANITRIRNVYLDSQYRAQNSALGGASAQAEELQQAQSAFNEPSDASVATGLSAFWTAWNNLADSPTSEAAKEAVAATGKQLASTINQLGAQLSLISSQVTEQVKALTGPSGEIENYATEIAQLNTQIKLSEEAGQQPNEELDRRDLLLDKLSALGNVTVAEQPDHTDTVSFGDAAKPLVEAGKVNWPQAITEAAGGKVGALLGLNGPKGAITELQNGLDGVAETLANTVNAQIPPPAAAFFSGKTAATLAVAVTPKEVTASGGGAAGGSAVARAIANLRGGEAERGYAALVAKLGGYVQTAKNDQSNLQTTVTAINDQRQSVSGVSLDEEMTNLIAFQRGYQASARTLTVMDEMLETLIDHTGSGM
jgi:flagellar hook-associated protein 1 FlgK